MRNDLLSRHAKNIFVRLSTRMCRCTYKFEYEKILMAHYLIHYDPTMVLWKRMASDRSEVSSQSHLNLIGSIRGIIPYQSHTLLKAIVHRQIERYFLQMHVYKILIGLVHYYVSCSKFTTKPRLR